MLERREPLPEPVLHQLLEDYACCAASRRAAFDAVIGANSIAALSDYVNAPMWTVYE